MATTTEQKVLTIVGARSVWQETLADDDDIAKLIRLLVAEQQARNSVVIIVCVGREQTPSVSYEN